MPLGRLKLWADILKAVEAASDYRFERDEHDSAVMRNPFLRKHYYACARRPGYQGMATVSFPLAYEHDEDAAVRLIEHLDKSSWKKE